MPILAGSASIKGTTLTLSITNAHARHAIDGVIDFGGRQAKELSRTTLTADDIHAHNTFEQPHAVVPSSDPSPTFPPASATVLSFRI